MLSHLRSRLLLSVALVAVVPAMAGSALAGDFVISTPVFTTNGGFTIDGDDSLTITNTGSITPPLGSRGVSASGANNTIAQSGSIATNGLLAFGVFSIGNDNTIAQSGSIVTSGNQAHGVFSLGSDNTITQSGSIATSGDGARGVYSRGDDNTITQSGSIATSGTAARGV
jgi:hypothetical protein